MSKIWVVTADTSRARIFSANTPSGPLVEIQTLTHPEARLHQGDLVSDRPGRDRNSGGGSHDMGHEADAKAEEDVRFAAYVCDNLEKGRISGKCERLYVIAAPGFLGLLRKQQCGSAKKIIAQEISKNLTTHSAADIRKSLPEYL